MNGGFILYLARYHIELLWLNMLFMLFGIFFSPYRISIFKGKEQK